MRSLLLAERIDYRGSSTKNAAIFLRSPNLRADLRSLGEAADSLPRGPPPYSVWCLFSTQPIHTCDATSRAMLDDFCVPEPFVLGSTLRRLSAGGDPFRIHGRLYAGAMRVSGTPGYAHLRLAAYQQQPKQLSKLLRTCDLSPQRHLLGERYSGLHKKTLLLFFKNKSTPCRFRPKPLGHCPGQLNYRRRSPSTIWEIHERATLGRTRRRGQRFH